MYVVCVTVYVKQGHEQDFIEATRCNHEGTLKEPGAKRFDVLRAVDDPTRFFLYEVYRSADDFAAHQKTEHYQTWRSTVADWMAQPRQGVKHDSLFPDDSSF
jgi:autoinducer 2-degrading protein